MRVPPEAELARDVAAPETLSSMGLKSCITLPPDFDAETAARAFMLSLAAADLAPERADEAPFITTIASPSTYSGCCAARAPQENTAIARNAARAAAKKGLFFIIALPS